MANFNNRSNSRFDNNDRSAPREMHNATCNRCGKNCKVPFKPSGSKPIFCSACFEQNENSGQSRDDRGEDRRPSYPSRNNDRRPSSNSSYASRRPANEARCDDCGKHCRVPFKPEPGKPVYCDNCFPKHSNNGADKPKAVAMPPELSQQLSTLNAKLDQVLEILLTAVIEVEDDEELDHDISENNETVDPSENIESTVISTKKETTDKPQKAKTTKPKTKKTPTGSPE